MYTVLIKFRTVDEFGAQERTWERYSEATTATVAYVLAAASPVVVEAILMVEDRVVRHFGAF